MATASSTRMNPILFSAVVGLIQNLLGQYCHYLRRLPVEALALGATAIAHRVATARC